MDYYVSFVGCDVVVGGGEVECFVKKVLTNGWIKFFDVKTNEVGLLFFLISVKPVDYRCGVFPLIKVAFAGNVTVDAVKDLFAYFAYFGFRRVD